MLSNTARIFGSLRLFNATSAMKKSKKPAEPEQSKEVCSATFWINLFGF
jgi:hypothetical protein